jgi:hypothetical protein
MNTTTTKIAGEAMTDEQIIEMAKAHCVDATRISTVLSFARALLASKAAVPEGWKLVPATLTGGMVDAYRTYWAHTQNIYGAWSAMLAAVPTAPAQSCESCEGEGIIDCYACPDCADHIQQIANKTTSTHGTSWWTFNKEELVAFAEAVKAKPTAPAQSCGDAEQADEALRTIHGLLHTQDNRITAAPMFAVQQKRRVYGIDTEYEPLIAWTNDEGSEASPEDAARFETAYDHDCDAEQEGYRRIGYHEYWEFVTGCFTEQGCKDYLARNGHNLNEPRIYAYGTYRNEEWKTIRDFLMSDRFSADAARTKDSK